MLVKDWMQDALVAEGIQTEVVGDAIYRFTQLQCEWMVPQHVIDRMLAQDADGAKEYITSKLFYLVRRMED